MESLQIRTGELSLNVIDDNGESRGVFKFNPMDLNTAQKLVSLQNEFDAKQSEFDEQMKVCETPEEKVKLMNEICIYFRNVIDDCFGEGSSQVLFGNAQTLSMFDDFFSGIVPYYEQASKDRIAKYKVTKRKK